MMYVTDIGEMNKRNAVSLAALEAIAARMQDPAVNRAVAVRKKIMAPHSDIALRSPAGMVYMGRPNTTIESALEAIVEIAGRKMVASVRQAFSGQP